MLISKPFDPSTLVENVYDYIKVKKVRNVELNYSIQVVQKLMGCTETMMATALYQTSVQSQQALNKKKHLIQQYLPIFID